MIAAFQAALAELSSTGTVRKLATSSGTVRAGGGERRQTLPGLQVKSLSSLSRKKVVKGYTHVFMSKNLY